LIGTENTSAPLSFFLLLFQSQFIPSSLFFLLPNTEIIKDVNKQMEALTGLLPSLSPFFFFSIKIVLSKKKVTDYE